MREEDEEYNSMDLSMYEDPEVSGTEERDDDDRGKDPTKDEEDFEKTKTTS